VEEDYAPKIDDEGKRLIGVIRSEAKRMGRLIDDLLAFSRLGRQQIEPKIIEMEPMALQVFDELKALEAGRDIRLILHQIPPAFGTEPMIKQVWTNLIANAIKFTGKKEKSEIEIGTTEGNEGERVYFVKDNGAGFDMRFVSKLFGVFSRLHNAEEFPGTGVGLALVQRIIMRHGGRVWGEGKVGQGATFYFTIPDSKKQNTELQRLPLPDQPINETNKTR
jgi:two-component system sensor kinase